MTFRQFDRHLAERYGAGESLEVLAAATLLPVPVVQLCIKAATTRWYRSRALRETIATRFTKGESLEAIAVGLDVTVPMVEELLRTEVRGRGQTGIRPPP